MAFLNLSCHYFIHHFVFQYTVVGSDGPAVLLVHVFGAFHEHYRDNLCSIAEAGNRVWAVTLLGFGKSEKPNIVYTELMWAELLRDFIIEVVGQPAHLVGNSMGGKFCLALTPQFAVSPVRLLVSVTKSRLSFSPFN